MPDTPPACGWPQFWDILAESAARQGMTLPRLLSQLHSEAHEIHGEVRNFASLLRNACVIYLKQGHQAPLAIAAEAGTKRRIRAVRLPSEPVSPEL